MTITIADIEAAAARIAGTAAVTPLLSFDALDERVGAKVLVKAEMLQRSGSFKFRGACNRLSMLTAQERAAGVVAWSSGNHAQAVAAVARLLGTRATIVMPSDAPAIKRANTLAYGAEVVSYDRHTEDREAISFGIARDRGAVVVPSYDDPHIIAGQGTVGLEIVRQAAAVGADLDMLLCCVGGGGLIAGTATAVNALSPATAVFGVEPAGFDDTARSLVGGVRRSNSPEARSICDALLAPTPGALTFPINQRLLAGGLVVSDDEVRDAMRFAFTALKLVIEPGGAVALAALLSGKIDARGKIVAIVVSGGNVDREAFAAILRQGDE
ncbi:threonine ammonia-lyase [Sandarakinorhabdus sp.]|uniref:threonine ammonia-lyase n=1 Tax=Sandarakinorhabdus sp. TaxID=1916663 RepID=UPI003F6E6B99